MKINPINKVNLYHTQTSFGVSKENHKAHIDCWEKAYDRTSRVRDFGTIGGVLGFLLWVPSLFTHNKNYTIKEKLGVGLITLSAISLLYESYKFGNYYNEEKQKY